MKLVAYDHGVDALALGMQRLDAAQTKDELVEALWDLRDLVYDQPEIWGALTAEMVLQGLAYELEQTPADEGSQVSVSVLASALLRVLDPRSREP
ncbi:hypothetical protein [Promicromonospora iranensis]|uniref:Phage gp6-like head-tail connector protein n=1 Tax=Promicromonospora iranensis TaxID=1105144 RepID=A0ABU2CTT4_9MICO|nr:hypothetical protein [Promicromonospora iranensis]MDR7384748.1 hypothetical protein [Promicromonospora iranensis]